MTLSSPLSHSFPHLSCFQAKSSQKGLRQERKWKDAVLIDSHTHMRTDQCLDLSGPWRQQALMCTTFLYVQTHLTSQKEKVAKRLNEVQKNREEGGKRSLFFLLSAIPPSPADTVPEPERFDQHPALPETPFYSWAWEIIFHWRKISFLITEVGTGHFQPT